jgi:hypothetical protein
MPVDLGLLPDWASQTRGYRKKSSGAAGSPWTTPLSPSTAAHGSGSRCVPRGLTVGEMRLIEARPRSGSSWTKTREIRVRAPLVHRADGEERRVLTTPSLSRSFGAHLVEFGPTKCHPCTCLGCSLGHALGMGHDYPGPGQQDQESARRSALDDG